MLFADIRNFTAYSERCEPEQIVQQLNAYFEQMVRCIAAEQGTVDKFIGDAVMAVFGGLVDVDNPCDSALRAAQAMRKSLLELNAGWAGQGLRTFENGIGLHYGPVLQGPIGSSARKEFTIIGDTVNISARLESLTKEYDQKVLCSSAFAHRLSPNAREQLVDLGEVRVRGRETDLGLLGC